jgi:hypothetical protein
MVAHATLCTGLSMQVGDTVIVKVTGRRARIRELLARGRVQVEYLPDVVDDPVDRDSSFSEDEGGIYQADDLQPLE